MLVSAARRSLNHFTLKPPSTSSRRPRLELSCPFRDVRKMHEHTIALFCDEIMPTFGIRTMLAFHGPCRRMQTIPHADPRRKESEITSIRSHLTQTILRRVLGPIVKVQQSRVRF